MPFKLPPDLKVIYFSLLLFSAGTGVYSVIMPAYIRELGANAVQLGLLGAIAAVFSVFAAIPGGVLSNRFERKHLMLLGWGMCVPAPLIFALAPNWLWLIPGYFLINFSMFSNNAMQSYLTVRSSPEERGFVFATVHASFPVGMLFAPTLGGFLADTWSMQAAFIASLIFYTLSAATLLLLKPNPPAPSAAKLPLRLDPRLYPMRFWRLVAVFVACWFIIFLPFNFNTPYLQDVAGLSLLYIGVLGSIGAVGGALLAPMLGRLADNWGAWRVLGGCLLVFAATFVLQLAFPSILVLSVVFFVRGGTTVMMPLMTSLISGIADENSLAMSFAMYNMMTGVATTIAPYTAGWLYAESTSAPFILALTLALLFGVPMLFRRRAASALNI